MTAPTVPQMIAPIQLLASMPSMPKTQLPIAANDAQDYVHQQAEAATL